jgi:hypothetical protein
MVGELPDVVTRYQDAHDDHDVDGALATFAPTATVHDEDQVWAGTTEIRTWLTKTSIEYTYTRTLLGAETTADGSWDVRSRLEGNFPGNVVDLHYRFELAGEQILSLTIAP